MLECKYYPLARLHHDDSQRYILQPFSAQVCPSDSITGQDFAPDYWVASIIRNGSHYIFGQLQIFIIKCQAIHLNNRFHRYEMIKIESNMVVRLTLGSVPILGAHVRFLRLRSA